MVEVGPKSWDLAAPLVDRRGGRRAADRPRRPTDDPLGHGPGDQRAPPRRDPGAAPRLTRARPFTYRPPSTADRDLRGSAMTVGGRRASPHRLDPLETESVLALAVLEGERRRADVRRTAPGRPACGARWPGCSSGGSRGRAGAPAPRSSPRGSRRPARSRTARRPARGRSEASIARPRSRGARDERARGRRPAPGRP